MYAGVRVRVGEKDPSPVALVLFCAMVVVNGFRVGRMEGLTGSASLDD